MVSTHQKQLLEKQAPVISPQSIREGERERQGGAGAEESGWLAVMGGGLSGGYRWWREKYFWYWVRETSKNFQF